MAITDVYLYSIPSGNDVRLRGEPSSGSTQGTLAVTLDDMAFAASAVAGRAGSMSAALDGITPSVSATSGHSGSGTLLLDAIAPSVSAVAGHTGNGTLLLDAITASAAATAGHTGASATVLGDVVPNISSTAGRWGPNSLVLDSIVAGLSGSSGRSGASSLALDGVSVSLSGSSGAPSSAGGGDYGPSPKRYVRKIGNRLVTFRSLQSAVSAVDVAPDKPEAEQSTPVVVEKVNVATIETMAKQHDAEDTIMAMFRAAEYDRIMTLVEEWRREEEDVELLLLSA